MEYGNHVQILTKSDESRDFDLLDGGDWYGVTISCDTLMADTAEPFTAPPSRRVADLYAAKDRGIHTWVSFEPVLDPAAVLEFIGHCACLFDRVKIGKLNYHPSDINWAEFGRKAEALCKEVGLDYYIKDSLRAEMERTYDGNEIEKRPLWDNLSSVRGRICGPGLRRRRRACYPQGSVPRSTRAA